MAIVVDPDNADRNQIVFGTENRLISIYPVGALAHTSATGTNGATSASTTLFTAAGQTFQTQGVAAGDVLVLFDGIDAAHYIVDSVPAQTQILVSSSSFDGHPTKPIIGRTFTGATNVLYQVRDAATGSVVDGITKQALYSFAKEEWRVDSNVGGLSGYDDNLIRHQFPYEPITSEQFEIGGGTSHGTWSYFNTFTRKKLRTGGWADKNLAGNDLQQWTGIITLGTLDSNTQVYYQPFSSSADPVNFDFLGAVNEPISVLSGAIDTRQYLKLFARKKGKTFAGSQISDIGVSTIQTIVNRFPLAHQDDAAIIASDAAISGSSPFRQTNNLVSRSDGATSDNGNGTGTLTSAGATFTSAGVQPGDVLRLTSGGNIGYYTIISINSQTSLTVNTSEEGPLATASSLSFEVNTIYVIRNRTSAGINNIDGSTGYLSHSGGGFSGVVSPNDLVLIISSAGNNAYMGVYPVVSVPNDLRLNLNTTDKIFVSASAAFAVVEPGMFLQRKAEATSGSAGLAPGHFNAGNLDFVNTDPDQVRRTTGNWITDGVSSGSIITISNTVNNNRSFTVASVNALTATLVASDAVVVEGPISASISAYDAFKRDINGTLYAFKWKALGNNSSLGNIYQFVQHQLRQPVDIDFGPGISRGDITDLLMQFATPTAQTFDMFVDNLITTDLNNITLKDATGVDRTFNFVAAGTISFNSNLQSDSNAVYRMFFTNDDAGDNTGRDYGTPTAIIVNNADDLGISGSVGGQPSISFTYDYDNNTQRGAASAGVDAPVTVVAIGLNTAQFVLAQSTIARSKSNNISLVSALERTYSNT